MQQSTTHSPLDVATDLPWQEQLLIRLDEIVGLLDSIDSRLEHREGKGENRCQMAVCQGYPIPDTGHLDTPNLPSATRPLSPNGQPPPTDAEEQPQ
jgi:hypothetical protein